MKVSIHPPLGYSYLGGRSNNEDAIFPGAEEATRHQPWFMVCDGVGGAARGEIASHIATESFNDYFIQNQPDVPTPAYIQSALDYVQAQFDDYLNRHPEAQGMATTLTLLYLHEAGATVAHIGDSRVYHLRNGRVIWRTEDHSLVNQLLKAGVISQEEAREHPQRNVIERAIQGNTKPVKAAVQVLNDIQPGDYFFLCTDGVLERVSDQLLENVLGGQASNEQKKQTLIDCCQGNTKDNFSAYLIQIETVSGEIPDAYLVPPPVYARPETVPDETVAVVAVDAKRTLPDPVSSPRSVPGKPPVAKPASEEPKQTGHPGTNSLFLLLTVALMAAILTMGGTYVYRHWTQPTLTTEPEQPVKNQDQPPKPGNQPPIRVPNPDKNPPPNIEAVEGITQVLGGDDAPLKITRTLFKKPTKQGWILVDAKDQPINQQVYAEIREPSDKFIAVRQKNKWGYLTLEGKTAIVCQFDEASDFEGGRAHVVRNGEPYEINKTGKRVAVLDAKTEAGQADNLSKKLVSTRPAATPI
ncbi:protein phosphatase 2C domain-containing protein [Larkinella sp. VNQ87]|uniref:protein phosphatase 2C domain-containing protein n=1 Tax=Larkinella sp. VNQ87 TaxID=3400921 RepID=UPI003C03E733